jgi:hypothetical protein
MLPQQAPQPINEALAGPKSAPIDSVSQITGYLLHYSPGNINPATEVTYTRLYIFDARGDKYSTEMQIWNSNVATKLPDAVQFGNGQIRCFAWESALPALLSLLDSGVPVWLQTKAGRVHFQGSKKAVTQP